MKTLALFLCIGYFGYVLVVYFFCQTARAPGYDLPAARSIAERYGVLVKWKGLKPAKTYHGIIQAVEAEPSDVEAYLRLLTEEVSYYSATTFRQIGLERIVLCRNLAFDGACRNAVPDFEHATLYLDVVRAHYDKAYLRRCIHHEIFHMLDLRDDGALYSDERWNRLNEPGFQYGKGGVTMQNDPSSGLVSDIPGFLNRYSTS